MLHDCNFDEGGHERHRDEAAAAETDAAAAHEDEDEDEHEDDARTHCDLEGYEHSHRFVA